MKQDLPCCIVQDLLPGCLDGVASEETCQLIREHLENCPQCRELSEEFQSPLPTAAQREAKDFGDFLKRVKWKNWLIGVLCTLAVTGSLLGAYILLFVEPFCVFSPSEPAEIHVFQTAQDELNLSVALPQGVWYQTFVTENVYNENHTEYELMVQLKRPLLSWPKNSEETCSWVISLISMEDGDGAELTKVYLQGAQSDDRRLLWAPGMEIDDQLP